MTTITINQNLQGTISKDPTSKVFLSAYICNMLEMYDFLITGMMFPYISQLFFPLEDKISVLLAGSLTFLVGFLMMPLGGILFGYIGDRYGRKRALLISISGMTLATVGIGLLPTYNSILFLSPILFVFLRLVQGLCLGGEKQGASIFTLEHYKGIRPGTRGALLATSNGMAALVAFFISLIATSYLSSQEGWRFCYLFGGSLGIVGLYLRFFINESPAFLQYFSEKTLKKSVPLISVLKNRKLNVMNAFLGTGVLVCLTYTGFTFVNLFLTQFLNFSATFSLSCAASGTIIGMIAVCFAGRLCDRFGLYTILQLSLLILLVTIFPIHWLLASGSTAGIFLSLLLLAFPTGGFAGCIPHLIASSFPPQERYTGSAFSNNLAQAFLGGVQPFFAIYLIKVTDVLWSPAIYTFLLAATYFLFLQAFGKKLTCFDYIGKESQK